MVLSVPSEPSKQHGVILVVLRCAKRGLGWPVLKKGAAWTRRERSERRDQEGPGPGARSGHALCALRASRGRKRGGAERGGVLRGGLVPGLYPGAAKLAHAPVSVNELFLDRSFPPETKVAQTVVPVDLCLYG